MLLLNGLSLAVAASLGPIEAPQDTTPIRTARADTSRPAVPAVIVVPDSADALLVVPPGADSGTLVLRDHVHIEFDDTTSGRTIRGLLANYEAEIVGGYPLTGTYVIRLPDPGPTYQDLEALMAQLRAESGVDYVYRFVYQSIIEFPGRYPDDGPDDATPAVPDVPHRCAWSGRST